MQYNTGAINHILCNMIKTICFMYIWRFRVKSYEFVTSFIISIASRLIHKYNIYINPTFGKADWPRVSLRDQPRIRNLNTLLTDPEYRLGINRGSAVAHFTSLIHNLLHNFINRSINVSILTTTVLLRNSSSDNPL